MSTRQEDLKLDRLELSDVVVALKDVGASQWYDLGLQLKLSPSILDTIAADHQISSDRKRVMLSEWLQSDPEASWEMLAAALALIGHETTAANVRAQFVKVAVQVVAEADQDEMRLALTKNNLQKIKAKFSSLSRDVQSALQSSQASVKEVYSFLVRCFSQNNWIQNPSSFDQLFNALSVAKLWNYDHYGPLEEITKEFLPNDVTIKKLVSEYKSHLTGFYTTTKISDFMKVHSSKFEDTEQLQDPQKSLPIDTYTLKDYRRLKMTLNLGQRKVSALTLSYVDELWRSLAEEFDLPCLTAVIDTIVKGSLQISWLILPHTAKKIMSMSASTKAVKFFHHHDITCVEIDNIVVYSEEEVMTLTEYEGQLFEICEGKGDVDAISELVHQHGVDVSTIINKEGLTPLCVASEWGVVNVVEALNQIQHGASINRPAEDVWGCTPLMYACREGYYNVAKLLVENGALVDLLGKGGLSALYIASHYRETAIVRLLLKYGADVDLPTQDESAFTALTIACENDDVETATVLLDYGANVDYQNKKGDSPLHIASQKDDVELVKMLLDHGAEVNLPNEDEFGNTALIIACQNGHVETARVLLDRGAVVDYQNKNGQSALWCASSAGETECVKVLMKYGAQVDLPDVCGDTALIKACQGGHVEAARVLLDYSANVDQHNEKSGQTILYRACGYNRLEIVKMLLEYGAQVNKANDDSYGDIPLTIACHSGNVDIATLLIDKGAVVNFQNKSHGTSPLYVACVRNHPHIARLLLERGAQVNMLNKRGISALATSSRRGYVEIVNVLLEFGAQVNLPNDGEWGNTALSLACRGGHVETARILLDHGANVDHQNKHGQSALWCASSAGETECVKVLLKYGAQVDLPDAVGVAPLTITCVNGRIQCAQLLIEHGAAIDFIDKEGWTAIFYAAEKGYVHIIQLMMDHGIDLELKDKDGLTAYDVASINSHPDVCHLMEAYGYSAHHSSTSETRSDTGLQTRHRCDEITSVQTFRAILECGSQGQSLDEASQKHQTSQMFEESEERL